MKALILLGCPEAPAQTPMALYTVYKLKEMGYDVTIACNPAANKLLEVSDPENYYLGEVVDLDKCLEDLSEKEYDLLVGLVHKDAAVAFFVTFYQILQTKSLAVIFERDGDLVAEFTEMIEGATDADIAAVRAYHNPNPIKVKLNQALANL